MWKGYLESLDLVESAFRSVPRDLLDILLEVRSLAYSEKPWATERIREKGITLFDSDKGGTVTGGICFVDILDGVVRVRFGLGAMLSDPESLLAGNQKYMRYLDISSFDDAPWEALAELIRESAHLDPAVWRAQRSFRH